MLGEKEAAAQLAELQQEPPDWAWLEFAEKDKNKDEMLTFAVCGAATCYVAVPATDCRWLLPQNRRLGTRM